MPEFRGKAAALLTRIGLLSDTHGYLDENVFDYFESCDEIWHAGDFGSDELAARMREFRPLRGVFGNIDGPDIRSRYPEDLIFSCEKVKVLMTHIGGYPPRYNNRAKPLLEKERPQLFICGHSHILKIIYDEHLECLHINPGAAGKQGWHKVRTLVRFTIDESAIRDCEVVELNPR